MCKEEAFEAIVNNYESDSPEKKYYDAWVKFGDEEKEEEELQTIVVLPLPRYSQDGGKTASIRVYVEKDGGRYDFVKTLSGKTTEETKKNLRDFFETISDVQDVTPETSEREHEKNLPHSTSPRRYRHA